MKKYVLKKGGSFVSDNGYSRKVSKALLYDTREEARSSKMVGERIYRVKLTPSSFEKVR